MEDFVSFTPHIMSLQCPNCVNEVRQKECISNGLYCLIPPKEEINTAYNVSDEALLLEVQYGRCLHEVVRNREPDLLTFFNYLHNTRTTCFEGGMLNKALEVEVSASKVKKCVQRQIENLGVDFWEVDSCVKNQFKTPGNNQTDNTLFFNDKLLAETYGISIHPSITINGQIYKGDLTGYDVFRAVCASYTPDFRPV